MGKFRGGLAVSQYSTDIERHLLSLRMTEVRVHAAFKVKDEATFLKEAAKIVEATQAEQGCIHYQLYKEAGDQSGSYAMIETWATQEDLTRHSKAAHVKAFQEATKGNIEATVQVFQPV